MDPDSDPTMDDTKPSEPKTPDDNSHYDKGNGNWELGKIMLRTKIFWDRKRGSSVGNVHRIKIQLRWTQSA